MTTRASRGSAVPRTWRRMALVAIVAVVLIDVMSVGRFVECRSFQNDQQRLDDSDINNYMADGAAAEDDEDSEQPDPPAIKPVILTTNSSIEAVEGTTVNLPCMVAQGSLDSVTLIWINGSKTIWTDVWASTTDPRVKSQPEEPPGYVGPTNHALFIEQVSSYDSGVYTCKITSTPPVLVTHTLRVKHPAKILSVISKNAADVSQGSIKKISVKQGEPVQIVCSVVGYPEPSVQWTRKTKYQTPTVAGLSPVVIVSKTNEVRIDSAVAYRDTGFYECVADNNNGDISTGETQAGTAVRMGIELDIEFKPDINVPRQVVNAGVAHGVEITCIIHSNPKPKVTWEKEQTEDSSKISWQTLMPEQNGQYSMQMSKMQTANISHPTYKLVVKKVQGKQDFGRYRCRAENKIGVTISDPITLTGLPAQPQLLKVHSKDDIVGSSEIEWTVDSFSPLLQYQLQYKRQQDASTMWTDVPSQPPVVNPLDNGDVHFSVSYVFGGSQQQLAQTSDEPQKSSVVMLDPGTTYVARLRSENLHGWSDWSTDVIFVGADDSKANEISQFDKENVKAASAGGNTGGASSLQYSTAIMLLAATAVAAVMSTH